MDTSILDDDTCLVCSGAKTDGLHFQLNVCRACAAFFRRAVKNRRVFRCKNGTKNCLQKQNANSRLLCKFCRLEKCHQLGMRFEDIEKDNSCDIPDVSSIHIIPKSIAHSSSHISTSECSNSSFSQINSPEVLSPIAMFVRNEGENYTYSRKIDPIVEKVKSILNQECSTPLYYVFHGVHMTPLQQLQHAFAKFLDQIQPRGDSIVISEYADKLEMFKFQEEYVVKLAEAVMYCEPFAVLPFEDKWLLFRHFWASFYSVERIFSSIEFFGYNLDDSRHLVTSKFAVDSNTKWTISEIPMERSMEFVKLIQPMEINLLENLAKPLKRLQVTRFEIVYLLAEMLWSVHEVKGISAHAKEIGDGILEQISSELHNFYIFDLRLYNYAARHARLVRLIPITENQVQLYKDYLTMAKIFNLFEYNLYESELVE